MTGLLLGLLVVGVIVVAVGLTVGTLLTIRRQRESFAAANEVVPGVPTRAPSSWAGSHDPEARLHRRLRDAVTALRSAPSAMDGAALEQRVELEQQALALDESLVAIAATAAAHRPEPLARVAGAVEVLEAAVADVAAGSAEAAASRLEAAVAEVRQQHVTLEEVRAELDRPPHLSQLEGAAAPETPDPEPPGTTSPR